MTTVVPISELKQQTGRVLSKAVIDRQDVIVERYGQEYAVILSRERYQELLNAARPWVREQFLAAQQAVHEATTLYPAEELETLVQDVITESRRERPGRQ